MCFYDICSLTLTPHIDQIQDVIKKTSHLARPIYLSNPFLEVFQDTKLVNPFTAHFCLYLFLFLESCIQKTSDVTERQ